MTVHRHVDQESNADKMGRFVMKILRVLRNQRDSLRSQLEMTEELIAEIEELEAQALLFANVIQLETALKHGIEEPKIKPHQSRVTFANEISFHLPTIEELNMLRGLFASELRRYQDGGGGGIEE